MTQAIASGPKRAFGIPVRSGECGEGKSGDVEFEKIYSDFFSPHAGQAGRDALADALKTPRQVAAAELRALSISTQAISKQLHQPVLWLTIRAANQPPIRRIFRDVCFGEVVDTAPPTSGYRIRPTQ